MTRIRNPFRRIPSGITKATSTILRQRVLRKRWDVSKLEMNSTQLERIPLHSLATSSVIPGMDSTTPSWLTGTPAIEKSSWAADADASAEALFSQFTAASGSGTMKTRNATGKAAAAIHFEPRNRNPPATTKLINERAIREIGRA